MIVIHRADNDKPWPTLVLTPGEPVGKPTRGIVSWEDLRALATEHDVSPKMIHLTRAAAEQIRAAYGPAPW